MNVPEVAVRFRDAVRATVQSLCQHPFVGPHCPSGNPHLQNLRSWPVIALAGMSAGPTFSSSMTVNTFTWSAFAQVCPGPDMLEPQRADHQLPLVLVADLVAPLTTYATDATRLLVFEL